MRIPLAQSASIVRAVPEQVQADGGFALAAELALKARAGLSCVQPYGT